MPYVDTMGQIVIDIRGMAKPKNETEAKKQAVSLFKKTYPELDSFLGRSDYELEQETYVQHEVQFGNWWQARIFLRTGIINNRVKED